MATSGWSDAWDWRKTAEKLNDIHIQTIEQLAKGNEHIIRTKIGKYGVDLQRRAKGVDDREVDPSQMGQHKSVGNSMTFSKDMDEEKELLDMLERLSKSVSKRLQKRTLVSYNIQIMIKYHDRRTVTRSKQLKMPFGKNEIFFKQPLVYGSNIGTVIPFVY